MSLRCCALKGIELKNERPLPEDAVSHYTCIVLLIYPGRRTRGAVLVPYRRVEGDYRIVNNWREFQDLVSTTSCSLHCSL